MDAAEALNRLPTDLSELINTLADGLRTLYGGRYRGLVLYGSYARGEADEGSDVDLLLLLGGEGFETTREILRAEDTVWPLSLESGYTLSLLPVRVEDYEKAEKVFLWNARREGIQAW